MMGHNICLNGVNMKIIPKLSLLPLLIWSFVMVFHVTGNTENSSSDLLCNDFFFMTNSFFLNTV